MKVLITIEDVVIDGSEDNVNMAIKAVANGVADDMQESTALAIAQRIRQIASDASEAVTHNALSNVRLH